MTQFEIFYVDENRALTVTAPETTILEAVIAQNMPLDHSCGGMGSCGTCRIIIESDVSNLPERTDLEREMAEDRQFADKERLACQLLAVAGIKFRRPDSA